jgi:biopolymer transport protein ExbB
MEQSFFIEQFEKGGPVMWPLLIGSLIALMFIVERIIAMARVPTVEMGESYLNEVEDSLRSGGRPAAVEKVGERGGVLAYVFGFLLKRYDALLLEERDFEDMRRELLVAADEATHTYVGKFLHVLSTIAQVSPLLGLLGTVLGMIKAFASIAQSGVGDPAVVAGGISEALITTATGLIVAVPVLILYRFLALRADASAERVELLTHAFATTLLHHGRDVEQQEAAA